MCAGGGGGGEEERGEGRPVTPPLESLPPCQSPPSTLPNCRAPAKVKIVRGAEKVLREGEVMNPSLHAGSSCRLHRVLAPTAAAPDRFRDSVAPLPAPLLYSVEGARETQDPSAAAGGGRAVVL